MPSRSQLIAERSAAVLQRQHGERSNAGKELQLTIRIPGVGDRPAPYSVVRHLSSGEAVNDFGEATERRETMEVAVDPRHMKGLPRPLPLEVTRVVLPDEGEFALDQQRGVDYGVRVVLRLAREPLEREANFQSPEG